MHRGPPLAIHLLRNNKWTYLKAQADWSMPEGLPWALARGQAQERVQQLWRERQQALP